MGWLVWAITDNLAKPRVGLPFARGAHSLEVWRVGWLGVKAGDMPVSPQVAAGKKVKKREGIRLTS